jgi:hypothetical protein
LPFSFFSSVLCGGGIWKIKSEDKCKFTAAEITFMRRAAKYIWEDYKDASGYFGGLKTEYSLHRAECRSRPIETNELTALTVCRDRLPKLMMKYCNKNQGGPFK